MLRRLVGLAFVSATSRESSQELVQEAGVSRRSLAASDKNSHSGVELCLQLELLLLSALEEHARNR